eukprot:6467605-Amphidinium_carterae.2
MHEGSSAGTKGRNSIVTPKSKGREKLALDDHVAIARNPSQWHQEHPIEQNQQEHSVQATALSSAMLAMPPNALRSSAL